MKFYRNKRNTRGDLMKISRNGTFWLRFWKMSPGWTPSFDKYSLNTAALTYNSALTHAENNFVTVFASILTSENGAYPLHWAVV